MSKHPSKQKRTRHAAVVSLLLFVMASAGLIPNSAAQTPQPAPPQQRPRRVGSTPPTSNATPAPRTSPTPAVEEVDEDDVVRVETQLVTVPVTVTDRTGR